MPEARRSGDDAVELERWRTDWSHGNIVARSDVSGEDVVICCDHLGPAWPSCQHSGCGLVTLGELVECFSSPHTYVPRSGEGVRKYHEAFESALRKRWLATGSLQRDPAGEETR